MSRTLLTTAALVLALAPALASAQADGRFERRSGGERAAPAPPRSPPPPQAPARAFAPQNPALDRGQRFGGDFRGGSAPRAEGPRGGATAPQSPGVVADGRAVGGGPRVGGGWSGAPRAAVGWSGSALAAERWAGAPRAGEAWDGRRGYGDQDGWRDHDRRPWRVGGWAPAAYLGGGYFIQNWWDLGLWEPAPGLEWIRVGPDALLVEIGTGRIVDVEPGVYY